MDYFKIIRHDRDNFNIENIDNINIEDENGENLLLTAIAFKEEKICLQLIDRGININFQNKDGHTALQYAIEHENQLIIDKLLSKDAKVNIRDNWGNNSLWTATLNARGNYNTVKKIIEAGGDAYTKNKYGRSPKDFAEQIADKKLSIILDYKNIGNEN